MYSCKAANDFENEAKGISEVYDKKCNELVRDIHESNADTTKFIVSIDECVLKELDLHQEQVRDLLNVQFERLQSERNVLEIWAASLTIVFMIFSFFSLFHTEDMMKEAREKLNKLETISSTAETKGKEIDVKLRQKLKSIVKEINDAEKRLETIKNVIGDEEILTSKLKVVENLMSSLSLQKYDIQKLNERLDNLERINEPLSAPSSISKSKDSAPDEEEDS